MSLEHQAGRTRESIERPAVRASGISGVSAQPAGVGKPSRGHVDVVFNGGRSARASKTVWRKPITSAAGHPGWSVKKVGVGVVGADVLRDGGKQDASGGVIRSRAAN